MYQSRVIPILTIGVTLVVTAGFTAPAFALAQANQPYMHGGGGHGGSGVHSMPKPIPHPTHMSGCCGSGGQMGGGSYSGGGHMVWGKPRLGTHPMGMHFYGMGGGGHIKYGLWSGGHSYGGSMKHGSGGASYAGSWGAHAPLGTHAKWMHYYGLSGGSLAARYGQLAHDYGYMRVPTSWGYGSNGSSYGGGSSYGWPSSAGDGSSPKMWGTPVSSKPAKSYSHHYSYRAKYAFHRAYHDKVSHKSGSGGGSREWGSSAPSSPKYAAD